MRNRQTYAPALEAGYDVEGFDASPFMLNAFSQKFALTLISNNKAPISQAFIQKFKSSKKYGLIFIPFGSLGLITNKQELVQSLQNMYNLLLPGGSFIIEIDTIESIPQELGALHRGIHKTEEGAQIKLDTIESYNPTTQILTAECNYQLIVNGIIEKTEVEPFSQYLYQLDEMDTLLTNCGFFIDQKYKNYEKEPVNNQKSDVVIYMCHK